MALRRLKLTRAPLCCHPLACRATVACPLPISVTVLHRSFSAAEMDEDRSPRPTPLSERGCRSPGRCKFLETAPRVRRAQPATKNAARLLSRAPSTCQSNPALRGWRVAGTPWGCSFVSGSAPAHAHTNATMRCPDERRCQQLLILVSREAASGSGAKRPSPICAQVARASQARQVRRRDAHWEIDFLFFYSRQEGLFLVFLWGYQIVRSKSPASSANATHTAFAFNQHFSAGATALLMLVCSA
jgi:hypothetical protein